MICTQTSDPGSQDGLLYAPLSPRAVAAARLNGAIISRGTFIVTLWRRAFSALPMNYHALRFSRLWDNLESQLVGLLP